MHVLTLIVWIASLALLGIAAFYPKVGGPSALGLFAFDLWLGLQFLLEASDPITF